MLKIGIIGAGAIASIHIDSYLQFQDECQVKAVCDRFINKAEELIKEKLLDARAYQDYQEMLEDPEIDAVSICLPPSMHCAVTVDALNAHKHVLTEKPMASSLEECDCMIEAARKNGRLLSVVSQNRFKTPIVKVKKLLEAKEIGDILLATFHSLWWRGQIYYDLWWRGTWEKECGGCLMSQAVHYIDLMYMLFGMPGQVTGYISNVWHKNSECEDLAFALFQYEHMIACFDSSLVSHGEKQDITIDGEKASIGIPWNISASRSLPNGFPEKNTRMEEYLNRKYESLPSLDIEGHPAQIRNFLRAISKEETLLVDGMEGRNILELIIAVYKSAATGKMVSLPLRKEDPFYCKESMIDRMPHFNKKTKSIDNFSMSRITLGSDMGK